MPLVRICAGGGQRWPSLPRLVLTIYFFSATYLGAERTARSGAIPKETVNSRLTPFASLLAELSAF